VLSSPDDVSAPLVDDAPREPSSTRVSEAAARRAFSTSMLVSATRCLLTYIVLPFVAPLLGIAGDVGPGVGIAIGLVAIVSNVLTIRRFHAADHRWRWAYTGIAVCVIIGLVILMVRDVAEILS
jgi:hypothetical protein